jgi:hypothetical protein
MGAYGCKFNAELTADHNELEYWALFFGLFFFHFIDVDFTIPWHSLAHPKKDSAVPRSKAVLFLLHSSELAMALADWSTVI